MVEEQEKKLEKLRLEINENDDKIIALLNRRGEIARAISEIKKSLKMDVFQPLRENEIIKRIRKKAEILKPANLESIWKEIMGACKEIQDSIIKVGYLGPKGTFTHQAALDYFPEAGTEFVPLKGILDIFEDLERDNIEYGVVPIENSLQGTVRETLDYLIEKNITIFGEVVLRINQNLISLNGASIKKLKTLYSHPQAFAQTRVWIKNNLPAVKLINMSSTSAAMQQIKSSNDLTMAAIGTEISGKIYGLKVLSSKIEDIPDNLTRFLIISKKDNELKEGRIKTSIVYVTKHIPGALYKVLKMFADGGINLTKIESRPRRKGKWEYIFLMDFEGDKSNEAVISVIKNIQENVIFYKILGSYPFSKSN